VDGGTTSRRCCQPAGRPPFPRHHPVPIYPIDRRGRRPPADAGL